MSAMVAVFTRELQERSRIFLVAVALSVVPFLTALFPAAHGQRASFIATLGGSIAVVYATAVAIILGVSVLSRDLAQKRLSFYFSRPITPLALWSGKALASMLTIFAALLITGVPALVVARDAWWPVWRLEPLSLAAIALAFLTLFLVSHAFGTMVRSRSVIVAIDFVCVVAAVGLLYMMTRALIGAAAAQSLQGLVLFTPLTALVLAVAPVWQLARGRTDARRSHAALSQFVWIATGVILLFLGAVVWWMVHAPFSTIEEPFAFQSGDGNRVFIAGRSTRRTAVAGFVNTKTGEQTRISSGGWAGVGMSRDGSTALTYSALNDFGTRHRTLHVRRFAEQGRDVEISLSIDARTLDLSADGSRVAILAGDQIQVYDTRSGAIVGAARIAARQARIYFVTPSLVRLVGERSIQEFDVTHRTVAQTGVFTGPTSDWSTVSDDGTRMYTADGAILDARSGAVIATLEPRPRSMREGAMMGDGRVVFIADDKLHVYDRDGKELRVIALPPLVRAVVRAQVGDSKVIVGGSGGSLLVDVDRGTLGASVKHVRGPLTWWGDSHLMRLDDDAVVVSMNDQTKKLVTWDPRTGEVKPLPL